MNKNIFNQKIKSCKELLLIQNSAVTNILERRTIFNRFREIIKNNNLLKNTYNIFWDWYFFNYVDAQVMEISRVIDSDKNSQNIVRLTDSLIKGYRIDSNFFGKINEQFNNNSSVPLFNFEELENDKKKFEEKPYLVSTRKYRDTRIAHHDVQKWKYLDLNLLKLDSCIDFLHERILYHELRLNGSGYGPKGLLVSNINGWDDIFKIPWIDN